MKDLKSAVTDKELIILKRAYRLCGLFSDPADINCVAIIYAIFEKGSANVRGIGDYCAKIKIFQVDKNIEKLERLDIVAKDKAGCYNLNPRVSQMLLNYKKCCGVSIVGELINEQLSTSI